MAFGSSMKEQPVSEKVVYEQQFLDVKTQGTRTFRLLPLVDEQGNLVGEDERGETANEVRWAEIWWVANAREVKANPNVKGINHRVIVDWKQPFKNPIWDDIMAVYEKDDENRPKIKHCFALNVYDRTLVLPNEQGDRMYVTQNDKRQYVTADGRVLKGAPKPANKISVFTGSTGKEGGKHLFQQLCDLMGTVEHPTTGEVQRLHEFDIKLKISGSGMGTRRSFQLGIDYNPLPTEVLVLPRWDIAEYAQPWPNEMLQRLVNGESYKDLLKEYKIMLFPRKIGEPSPYDKVATISDDELFD